jgi:hypothetical protein
MLFIKVGVEPLFRPLKKPCSQLEWFLTRSY